MMKNYRAKEYGWVLPNGEVISGQRGSFDADNHAALLERTIQERPDLLELIGITQEDLPDLESTRRVFLRDEAVKSGWLRYYILPPGELKEPNVNIELTEQTWNNPQIRKHVEEMARQQGGFITFDVVDPNTAHIDYYGAEHIDKLKRRGLRHFNPKRKKYHSPLLQFRSSLVEKFAGMSISKITTDTSEKLARVKHAEDRERLPFVFKSGGAVPQHMIHRFKQFKVPVDARVGEDVTIFRMATVDREDIKPGDWVTFDPEYAKTHSVGRGSVRLIEKVVPAQDVIWAGSDWNEWFYAPASMADNSQVK